MSFGSPFRAAGEVWVTPYRHEHGTARAAVARGGGGGRGCRRVCGGPPGGAAAARLTGAADEPRARRADSRGRTPAGGRAVEHADGGPAVHAEATRRRDRRVPLLPRRPGPARPGVPDRQHVPAQQCRDRAPRDLLPGEPAEVPAARELDARAPADGWTCFGGTGIGGDDPGRALADEDWVAAWAPGGLGEDQTPAGTGYLLRPGDRLVMQVHYNLLNEPAGQSDRPGIRLRLMAATAALTPLQHDVVAGAGRAALPGRVAERRCVTGRWRCST